MDRLFGRFGLLVVLVLISVNVFAWDATGHRLIAEIAWGQLKPGVKWRVNKLIHVLDKDYGSVDFVNASTWADWIRSHNVNAFDSWHFINNPIIYDHIKPPPLEQKNIVWGIGQSEQVLESNKSNTFEKAFFLRFLIHLVGDAHQPLHTVTRYSHRFPLGDRGGNLYDIRYRKNKNLHQLWDRGVGRFKKGFRHYPLRRRQIIKRAHELTKLYPKTEMRRAIDDLDPSQWMKENYKIAKEIAYQVPYQGIPSKHYIKQGQDAAGLRATLAGYRLAKILNRLLNHRYSAG